MNTHDHSEQPAFDEAFWDGRYRSSGQVWSGQPNAQLMAEVANLAPGRALDVGCGEGADAIWLAGRGWEVVAADISGVALGRAERHARDVDPVASSRIEYRRTDLVADTPDADSFDLVTSQFMQLPPQPRTRLFAALIQSVRLGGTLLVVGHHPSDLATGVPRPPMPELFYSADQVAGLLDNSWTVVVEEARPRTATTPQGDAVTIHDAVLRAIHRPVGASAS
jgi:SAM-dependent methyltransferase